MFEATVVQSTKEKHGDNGMFFIDDPQSDQAVEGSADFEDTDASSGIGDDEDAEGSGDDHLSEEEMGSGTEENTIPELSGPVTSTKGPRVDIAQGPPSGGYDDDNLQSNNIPLGRKQDNRPSSFFAQPGILAAVIGGAVVGLLCAILLVMFIVYRMRKKDEGSYALDEPKRSPTVNSYMRSSNKEFYA
ncbi:hypothetical protein HPB52_016422 [Rhipicephalus sanguineus]|uniref:Syndecan n=1 Tax=Rhipicephalus sanguineus TaxID=34632 RepID=A0A9D4T2Q2_RHISA|nr:hypothetical protein HPB52_016422 [Rhipicephalus sanguineus]